MFNKKPENINRTGRPKGSENKDKILIKDFINEIVIKNKNQLLEDFKTLEPNERIKHTISLMRFIIPFAKETEPENPNNDINFKFEIIKPVE